MIYLICYDITNNKTRDKIARKLLSFGLYRMQYSVFIGLLTTPLLDKLKSWLKNTIGQSTTKDNLENIAILVLSKKHLQSLSFIGQIPVDLDEIMGTKNTIYIG